MERPSFEAIDSDEISLISYVDSDNEQSVANEDGDTCDIDDEIIELGTQSSWNVVDETTDDKEHFDRVDTVITESHDTSNVLNDESRLKLIDDILDCYFNDMILIKKSIIRDIAKRICEIFEHEDAEIYFSENGKKVSGKLYHRYNNRLKKLRTENSMPPSKRAKRSKIAEEEVYLMSEEEKTSIDFLKKDMFEDIKSLVGHWTTTFGYRQSLIKDSKRQLQEILEQWECLEFPFSHVLICQDFRDLYGFDSAVSLRRNWNEFFDDKKIEILRTKVKDRSTLRAVKNLPSANEYTSVAIVYYLNAVLSPPLMTKHYKPSIKNAQDSVLMEAGNDTEIDEKVSDFSKTWTKHEIEPHPLIFWIASGDDLKFVLIFHRLRYEFKTFVECMDVCFKLYFTLNMKFPCPSKQYFQFINEIFYKIPRDDNPSSKILILLQDLQDLKNDDQM